MKKCYICKEIKNYSLFSPDKKSKDKCHSYCKECQAKVQKDYRTKNRDYVLALRRKNRLKNLEKDYHNQRKEKLKANYGLSLEDYNELLSKQNNSCALCNKPQTDCLKPLFVDHCHTNKKVRGLLCHHCNAGLGLFKDNIEVLQKAVKYLKDTL